MIYGKSDIGLVREKNEDALFYDDVKDIMIIADGIGGHAYGEKASRLAIEVLKNFVYTNYNTNKKTLLYNGFIEANQAVHQMQLSLGEGKICGTTLSASMVYDNVLYFAHVGDSRIYVSRDKKDIEQISYDHTYLSELARNDFKTFIELHGEQLSKHNNYLTKAIGPEKMMEPQIGSFFLKDNDYIILTTDGVHRYLNPLDILNLLKNTNSIEEFADSAIEKAIEMGGKDNLTIIIMRYNEGRLNNECVIG